MARAPQAATPIAPTAPEPQTQNEGIAGAFPSVEQAGLMKQLFDAEAGGLFLPQSDLATSVVTAGWAEVDLANTKDNAAFVALTDEGVALVENANPAPVPAKAKTAYEIDTDVPMPTGKRAFTRQSSYPIEQLEIGQSFHEAAESADDNVMSRMRSTVSNFRRKWSQEVPGETEVATTRDFQKDANGKRVKGPDGKFVYLGSKQVTVAKTVQTRDWIVRAVDASDKRGAGVRVFRTL